MCDKRFTTRKQANDHICMEGDIVPQICEKSDCKKQYISSSALKEHMKTSHFGNKSSVCPKCGQICNEKREFKKHIESCGKQLEEGKEKSREVCYHWTQLFQKLLAMSYKLIKVIHDQVLSQKPS